MDLPNEIVMNTAMTDNKPWYRQLWPWILIGIPGSSFIYCAIFITMALTTENSLVSDDYYKDGLAINKRLERDRQAGLMGVSAEYSADGSNLLQVRFRSDSSSPPDALILRLTHPTIEGRDQLVRLSPTGEGQFQARLPEPLEGRWYLDLRDASDKWRLYGAGYFPAEQPIHIEAAAANR